MPLLSLRQREMDQFNDLNVVHAWYTLDQISNLENVRDHTHFDKLR